MQAVCVTKASQNPGAPLPVALGALAAFGLLAAAVVGGGAPSWDQAVFRTLYSGESTGPPGAAPNDSALLDALLPWIYRSTDPRAIALLVVLVLLGLLLLRRPRHVAFVGAACALVLAAGGLKDLFGRPSPFTSHGGISFPSGHAIGSLALALSLALVTPPRLRPLVAACGIAFVIAVAIAVVADGGHWPTDVLAGWLLAIAWVSALLHVFRIDPPAT